ncbi:MAG: ribonuclease Z [Bacteroidia bacterium]|nr:ribonuclease Z [Bacteroidia bacterium]
MSNAFELTILGTSSAAPTRNRQPTAQVLNVNDRLYLIDCGEATQIQLKRYKIKFSKIDHIFISHLHGDHYLGLLGLISSMHLEGRTSDLHIYGPHGLDEIINIQLKYSQTQLKYKLHFNEVNTEINKVVLSNDQITVSSIPLKHRIPCTGYLFLESQKQRKIRKDKLEEYQIPVNQINDIKDGADFTTESGEIIPNEELTLPPAAPRSLAYCSDTAYHEDVIPIIQGADILYHEATFTEDLSERAHETYHSTTIEAGRIAHKAKVKKLIIGHFSARYSDLGPLLEETKTVFENSYLAIEGETYNEETTNTSQPSSEVLQ